MNGRLTPWLLAFLTAAFLAWAGVVYAGVEKVSDKLDNLTENINAYELATERRLVIAEQRIKYLEREREDKVDDSGRWKGLIPGQRKVD